MKGTEKQIAWAKDIIETWKPIWDKNYAAGLAYAEAKLAEARADDRGYPAERQQMRLERLERHVNNIKRANEIWNSLDDAAVVIENRGVLMCASLTRPLAGPSLVQIEAAKIVERLA